MSPADVELANEPEGDSPYREFREHVIKCIGGEAVESPDGVDIRINYLSRRSQAGYREDPKTLHIDENEFKKLYASLSGEYGDANSGSRDRPRLSTEFFQRSDSASKIEMPVRLESSRGGFVREDRCFDEVEDVPHGLSYKLGYCSAEYCLRLIYICLAFGRPDYLGHLELEASHRSRIRYREDATWRDVLVSNFRICSIRVTSETGCSKELMERYSSAFSFECMYRHDIGVLEITDVADLLGYYRHGPSRKRARNESPLVPPQKNFDSEVVDYYRQGVTSSDPFVQYISYYHVLEFFFEKVFKEAVAKVLRDKIQDIDFSYETRKLYSIAKKINKEFGGQKDAGFGNEFTELRHVIGKYVEVEDLKSRIEALREGATGYYSSHSVPFCHKDKKTLIDWGGESALTNIATRVYQTRNSLIHSKDRGEKSGRYNPYKNANSLRMEIPLVRALSERVINESGESLKFNRRKAVVKSPKQDQ